MKDEVFLTGATGFVGSHVLDALLEAGYPVRALVRGLPERWPDRAGVTTVVGDLERSGDLVAAMRGCRLLVHVAAQYSFAPRRRRALWRANVNGTAGLLEAARIAGIEKAVLTSSSAVVGPAGNPSQPATEEDHARPGHQSGYHASKVEQEKVAVAAQIPVTLVLPTAPVGPRDSRPTPTGRLVRDYMKGRMIATIKGGMNLVPVEDVARGHILALERGWPNQRYLLGGENLSFDQIWAMLASITGRPAPRLRLPYGVVLGLSALDEARCWITKDEPFAPLEGARLARSLMYASSERAARHLGWWSGSVRSAMERSVEWYQARNRA
jgi:dihydroflavonol-4-reductase